MRLIFINFLFLINDICFDLPFTLKRSYIYSIYIISKYKRFLVNKVIKRLNLSHYFLEDILKKYLKNIYSGLLVPGKIKILISVKINNLTILIKSILTWYKNINRITILNNKKLFYFIQLLPSVLITFLYLKSNICYCRSALEREVSQLITTVYESGNYREIQNCIHSLNIYKEILIEKYENISELRRRIRDKVENPASNTLKTCIDRRETDYIFPKDYIYHNTFKNKLPSLEDKYNDIYQLIESIELRVDVGQEKLEEDF